MGVFVCLGFWTKKKKMSLALWGNGGAWLVHCICVALGEVEKGFVDVDVAIPCVRIRKT